MVTEAKGDPTKNPETLFRPVTAWVSYTEIKSIKVLYRKISWLVPRSCNRQI